VTAGVSCCGDGDAGRALSEPRWKMAPDLMGSRRGVRATTEPPSFKAPPLSVVMALQRRTARVLACHCRLCFACPVLPHTRPPEWVDRQWLGEEAHHDAVGSNGALLSVCAQQCVSAPCPLLPPSRGFQVRIAEHRQRLSSTPPPPVRPERALRLVYDVDVHTLAAQLHSEFTPNCTVAATAVGQAHCCR
jgi:hypothetical protein